MKERVLCNSVFLCLATILKKEHKEKGKEVLKKRKEKAAPTNKKEKATKKKNSEMLASFCGLVVNHIVVCLN